MSELKPDRCPICGGPNECGMAAGKSECWCASVKISAEAKGKVPKGAKEKSVRVQEVRGGRKCTRMNANCADGKTPHLESRCVF